MLHNDMHAEFYFRKKKSILTILANQNGSIPRNVCVACTTQKCVTINKG